MESIDYPRLLFAGCSKEGCCMVKCGCWFVVPSRNRLDARFAFDFGRMCLVSIKI